MPVLTLAGAMAAYASGNISGWLHPALLSAVEVARHLTNVQSSLVLAFETLALAMTSLFGAAFIRGTTFSRLAITGALIAIAGNLLSALDASYLLLVAARAINGIGLGLLLISASGVVATMRGPERAYGYLNTFSTLFGSLLNSVMYFFIIPNNLFQVFLYMAAGGLLLLPALWLVPTTSYASNEREAAQPEHHRIPSVGLALVFSTFTFSVGSAAVWTFTVVIGRRLGIPVETMSSTLATAGVAAVVMSFIVAMVGARFGRVGPILGALLLGAASNTMVLNSVSPIIFSLGVVANVSLLYFLLPMMLGYAASVDPTGRTSGMVSGACLGASAVGPALAGTIVDNIGFWAMTLIIIASYAISIGSLLIVSSFSQRGKIVTR